MAVEPRLLSQITIKIISWRVGGSKKRSDSVAVIAK